MKTAIVFGATSGIGKEISELLLKDGYRVAITGRRLEKLEALKKQYSNQVYVAQNDIQKVDEVENVFNEIIKEFTTIDIIIQSSGVGHINPTLAWNKEEETIFTNVVGATKLYDLSFNLFRNQGFGHLVGITSIASIRGNRGAPAYFSSKAYQKAYLESLYMKTKTIKSNKVFITGKSIARKIMCLILFLQLEELKEVKYKVMLLLREMFQFFRNPKRVTKINDNQIIG